ncbi:hypothetical protein UPYG_G00078660 [Umbra pygmaea]|uniref:Bulb-type lectin domain-containing protein n=1 Tax=Umbra pygmaea TaxID=75934 RepID=A0ABD0XDQ9_UMBPY
MSMHFSPFFTSCFFLHCSSKHLTFQLLESTMSRNYLSKDNELRKGDFLQSNNKEWKAVFQDDGNFVIYGWKPFWSADTNSANAYRLCMQGDCNLVMYKQDGGPMWQTNTAKPSCNMCQVKLTDHGDLVLQKDGVELWSSKNSKGMK